MARYLATGARYLVHPCLDMLNKVFVNDMLLLMLSVLFCLICGEQMVLVVACEFINKSVTVSTAVLY